MKTQEHRQQSSGTIRVMGIIMLAIGIIALIGPWFLASLAVELVFAWVLLVYGIVQFVYAFSSRSVGGFIFKLLYGIVSLIAGIILLLYPLAGVVRLSLVLGIYIFLDGVFRVIMAFQLRPLPKWGWVLFNGIVSIILGILIWSQWPFDAGWILGLYVGLSLIFNGIEAIIFPTSLPMREIDL